MSVPDFTSSPQVAWEDLRRRLQALRKADQRVSVIQGVLLWLAGVCVLIILMTGLEAMLRFSPPVRLFLVCAGAGVALALLGWRCLFPMIRPRSDLHLARRLERRFSGLDDRLTMALQLWRQREARASYASPVLLDAAIVSTIGATRTVDFTEAADHQRIRRALNMLGGTVVFGSMLFTLLYGSFSGALERLSHPLTDFPVPQRTFIAVEPGHIEVPAGSHVTITASLSGEIPEKATLHLSSDTRKPLKEIALTPLDATTFSTTLRDLRNSLVYDVEAGDAVSDEYEITVIDRPTIASLQLTYHYPEYTRLAPKTTADGTGDIIAVKGTRVTVQVEANQSLASADMVMSDAARKMPMTVSDRKAIATIHVLRDQRYHLELRNTEYAPGVDPPQYQITALPDRSPDVRIVAPGRDTNLTENMMLPLLISATDDFGFSSMNLVYWKRPEGKERRKFIPVDSKATVLSTPYVWDLSNAGLFPEDILSYYVEVFDNDAVSGPKRAVSQTFTVRFPSVVEIYKELEAEQTQRVTDMEEMLKEQRAMRERLQNLSREMTQKTSEQDAEALSWEQKQDLESLVQKQEQMAREVLKAAEAMEQAIQQLEAHDMMNMEMIEKMNRLRELFQEIATPELLKAMQELRKSMEAMNRQKIAESMEAFEFAQEEFMKRLERSLSILKRMQAEHRMDLAVKKSQELIQRQEELQYATQNASQQASQETRENLASKQSGLREDTEAMQRELEALARDMEALQAGMPSDEVRDVAESMQQQRISQQMSRISQQLSSGQMGQAAQGQQQAVQSLSRLSQQLQSAQQQMQTDQKQEIAGEMRGAMRDLVNLSQGQEALRGRTAQPPGRDSRTQELAEDQQSLLNGAARIADQLVETSHKSFFLSPQVGRALGESLSRMQNASNGLSEQQRNAAMQQQMQAMEALNQTVLALRQAMQDMRSARSATGLMEMMQQLQSMAQQQSGLNDELSQLMQQQNGGRQGQQQEMSMEERARMSRLAAQQEALRKSLEQLQREHREQSQLLGRLSEIEREMQESIRQLQQMQADPKLIERQHRILSRLLDASRSIRERDFDNKRQAIPGQDIAGRPSPGPLPERLLQPSQTLRDDLLRGIQNGVYPREYEELIRAYFRALSETTPH